MPVQADGDMTPTLSHGKACFKLLQAKVKAQIKFKACEKV